MNNARKISVKKNYESFSSRKIIKNENRVRKAFNFSFSFIELKFNAKQIFKTVKISVTKNWFLILFLTFLCFIPTFVYKAVCAFESKLNPLVLHDERNFTNLNLIDKTAENISGVQFDEFELLNKQMALFALESSSEIEDDGSVVGAFPSYSFKDPVTYTTYTVKPGDTISAIILKFNLKNISTLIAVNNIENVRALNAGQKIIVPSVDGLFYKVQSGDTIQSIAKKYEVSLEDLLDINDLDSEILNVGKSLFIPGAKLDKTTLRNAMGDSFIDPLRKLKWRLTSRCGWRADPFTGVRQFHPGVDMAISQGTPIYAALSGKVVACGWSNVYGNYVIIDHQNGYQSLYGHMSKKLCTLNQEVTTATKIGLVGSTGYSTGPHLHFTVYKNGKVVDPLTLIK